MQKRNLRKIMLGGQDGLVNVLGLVLVMASATNNIKIVIIAGLAAMFAESLSMAGVGYTSARAALDYYQAKLKEEKEEVKYVPGEAKKEIKDIYERKGFKGKLLSQVVKKIISKKRVWVETMMNEELCLHPEEFKNPFKDAAVIGFSSVIGSFVPLLPFFFVTDIYVGMAYSFILTLIVLFLTGVVKARVTIGHWLKSGLEITIVGIGAALLGYLIGHLLSLI
ncbi:MAG: VIT1/CCC1 transporter family protein [Nanoarchaeota archaeon]|nr:VIT1/CCC1 transporter family protein [Nanoarchaeota archaeon]